MSAYQLGTGFMIAKRTDTANTPPFLFGALQDVTLDIDQKLEALYGQYRAPIYIGDTQLTIKGKAKYARLQMTEFANLMFAATVTTSSGLDMTVPGETGTPTSAASSYIVTNSSKTPLEDFGVFYASSGIQLTPQATSSALAAGQYFWTASSGTYQFASSDVGTSMNFYYTYTVSSGVQVINSYANPLMGTSPVFEIWFKNQTSIYGVSKVTNIKINSCKASKLSLPFSNSKWAVPEFDFEAFQDASGNIFTLTTTE